MTAIVAIPAPALTSVSREECRLLGMRQQANVTHVLAGVSRAPLDRLAHFDRHRPHPILGQYLLSCLGILVRQIVRAGFSDIASFPPVWRVLVVFKIWYAPPSSWRP